MSFKVSGHTYKWPQATTLFPSRRKYKPRYISYVIINKAAVKIVEAQIMDDINAYTEMYGYTNIVWRIPQYQTYTLIKTKEW